VSCGGGVILDKINIENIKKTGLMVCLVARPEVILERTKGYSHRPLLNMPDFPKRIEELLKLRAPYYAQADYTIDTSDLNLGEVIERILNIISGHKDD
jgi:shikimate kinase